MAKILIVEDDFTTADGIADRLAAEDHEVIIVGEGKPGLDQARTGSFDLIILDIVLPGGLSGLDVCKQLRQEGNRVLILMLTGKLKEEIDRVRGLDLGADDYMVKPFSVAELQARIRALLRRIPKGEARLSSIRFGKAEVDFVKRVARMDGQEVHLSPKAFDLLEALVHHRGNVVDRDALVREAWGYDARLQTNRSVDVMVTELRSKLEADPRNPKFIVMVYGVGYRFLEWDVS